ncbi:MAG: hypothetical protein AAGE65_00230 [Planctomycetota bacterium]
MPALATSSRPPATRPRQRACGFTLIEAALTTVIVGTGVLALVGAQQAYSVKNDYAVRANLAQMLANEIRELTANKPHHDPITGTAFLGPEPGELSIQDYDDLDDFAGTVSAGLGGGLVFNPPINAAGVALEDMDRWTQEIRVFNVWQDYISQPDSNASLIPLGTTDVMRVTVTMRYRENDGSQTTVTTMTWAVPEAD